MTRQQIIQLIIFALFIGASGISWLLRKLAEEAQKRAARQKNEERRLEALRTGRDDEASERVTTGPAARPASRMESRPQPRVEGKPTATTATAGSIAERRQRQIEELRRRQMARAGTPNVPSGERRGPAIPTSIPGSTGTTVPSRPAPRPDRQNRTERQNRPERQSKGAGRPERQRELQQQRGQGNLSAAESARRDAIRRQQERAREAAERARQQASTAFEEAERRATESTTHRLVAGESSEGAYSLRAKTTRSVLSGSDHAGGGHRLTVQDLRRALIVSEILNPPVSLRD